MGHGKVPNLLRRAWIAWQIFWYKQQQMQRRKQILAARARWSAIPQYMDDLNADIAALECLIADLEQENL